MTPKKASPGQIFTQGKLYCFKLHREGPDGEIEVRTWGAKSFDEARTLRDRLSRLGWEGWV
jgi:hypothetical protein